jgi:pimeloyl-ACP methyl ester carboxylesterase
MRGMIRLQLLALRSSYVRRSMANAFPEPDRSLLQNEAIREGFIGCLEECCRRGTRGAAQEIAMLSEPWGFELRGVMVPVFLWQGQRDGNVSADGARYLAGALTNCRAEFYPQDAHLSVMMNHHREIFGALRNGRLPLRAGHENLVA